MIPKITTSSTGRISVNSTIVWPRSSRLIMFRVIWISVGPWLIRVGWAVRLGPPPRRDSGKEAGYVREETLDRTRQQPVGRDDRERDDAEDDGVLDHRLTPFAGVGAIDDLVRRLQLTFPPRCPCV